MRGSTRGRIPPAFDSLDRLSSAMAMQSAKKRGEILTGLLYVDPDSSDLHDIIQTSETPLTKLTKSQLCPGSAALDSINAALR
jgi:2-oxoglutarate ferredoxin oxidoreductase subunit beta